MKSFFSMFYTSLKELKSIRCIAITGIFITISMVIEAFTIDLVIFKINFAFLAIAVIGMLFGPTVSLVAGFACDIVGFVVHPQGGFIPTYILVAGLQGLIYGIVLFTLLGVYYYFQAKKFNERVEYVYNTSLNDSVLAIKYSARAELKLWVKNDSILLISPLNPIEKKMRLIYSTKDIIRSLKKKSLVS